MLHFLPFCSAAQQTGKWSNCTRQKSFERTRWNPPKIIIIDSICFSEFYSHRCQLQKVDFSRPLVFFFLLSFELVYNRIVSTIVDHRENFSDLSRVSLADGKSMEQLAQRAATSLINPSTSSSMNVALMELTGEKIWLHQRERMRTEMGGGDVLTQLSCHFTVGISVNARWMVWKSDFVR